ncbi:MAG: tRNA lysidine(34) synthetase TilS [Thiotrichales bacterium]|nr:tRNA lysidine(34) synthetase TilS [Thiotrichales bacterium]
MSLSSMNALATYPFYCLHNAQLFAPIGLDSALATFSLSQWFLGHRQTEKPASAWVLALSGGLDSVVLLDLCRRSGIPFRALYVDHQLQSASSAWGAFCQDLCAAWGIEFAVLKVKVEPSQQQGLEAVARKARYRALTAALKENEGLFTAHHQSDQAETFLLNALRPSGIYGLAAMPELFWRQSHWHARPLLAFTRAQLLAYAQQHQLQWVEDPSNQDTTYQRNWLRQQLLPHFTLRVPQAEAHFAQSAGHLQEALVLLQRRAAEQLATQAVSPFFLSSYPNLDWIEHKNLLQYWLRTIAQFKVSLGQRHYDWLAQHWFGASASLSGRSEYRLDHTLTLRVYRQRLYVVRYRLDRQKQLNAIRQLPCLLFSEHRCDQKPKRSAQPVSSDLLGFYLPVERPAQLSLQLVALVELVDTSWYRDERKKRKHFFQQHQVPPWERPLWPVLCWSDAKQTQGEVRYALLKPFSCATKGFMHRHDDLDEHDECFATVSWLDLWRAWQGEDLP